MSFEVAAGGYVILRCKIGGVRAQRLFNFRQRPDIELALLALGIGIERSGKGPLFGGHFALEPGHRLLARSANNVFPLRCQASASSSRSWALS